MYDLRGLECSFLHKKLLGFAAGFIPGGDIVEAGLSLVGGDSSRTRRAARPASLGIVHVAQHRAGIDLAGHRRHGHTVASGHLAQRFAPGTTPCTGGTRRDVDGQCRAPGSPADRDIGGVMAAEAIMGRYGAGYTPGSRVIDRAICLKGDVLGNDDICYPRRNIRNKDRMWPKERKPLGTPGELNAVTTARRFSRRLQARQKSLQEMGMLPKPKSRSRARKETVPAHGHVST